MFRATMCPSSRETTVFLRHLVFVILLALFTRYTGMHGQQNIQKKSGRVCACSCKYRKFFFLKLTIIQLFPTKKSHTDKSIRFITSRAFTIFPYTAFRRTAVTAWYQPRHLTLLPLHIPLRPSLFAGQAKYALSAIKWAGDYFIKCHVSPNELYGQVGDFNLDHTFWGRPEDLNMSRPAYKIDTQHPGELIIAVTICVATSSCTILSASDKNYITSLSVIHNF